MGKEEIRDKLLEKLNTVPESEEDIVYILSRVRKILELRNHPDNYSTLNFYCNLTLHTKITRAPKSITDELKKFREGFVKTIMFNGSFDDFHNQLKDLLDEEEISHFYPIVDSAKEEVNNLLISVWSHTPIRIEYVESYDVTIEGTSDEHGLCISVESID